MKKSFSITGVAALSGVMLVGTSLNAAVPTNKKLRKLADAPHPRLNPSAAAGVATSNAYTTDFEAADGFTARLGDCVQNPACDGTHTGECGVIDGQGAGPYPAPWGISGTNVGNIEGHIDTVNPFGGSQHLRISKEICDNTVPFGFSVDARIPASPPLPGLIAPSTYSGQISMASGLFGVNVNWQPQSNSQGLLTSRVLFFYAGFLYILDDPGCGITFVPVFRYWDASAVNGVGGYQNITVHHDPCAKHICQGGPNCGGVCPNGVSDCRSCVGGDNDGDPCVGNFQCPGGGSCEGGDCLGRIDYFYGGNLIHTGMLFAGTSSEQFLIYTDNFPGDTDLDDLVIEVGEPCPIVCGDLEIGPGEECDGANDDGCPGQCVAAGDTGLGGEAECTCVIPQDPCDIDDALNGTNTAIAHSKWWTFTADTPAYGVELCGSSGFDSYLVLWTGSCVSISFVGANDDCDSSTAFGPGSDPLASCFDRAGPGSVGGPYESCLCVDTNIGQQYFAAVYGADAPFNVTNLTLNKRLTCDAVWENGACTDCLGNCTDDVAEADCQNAGDVYVAQKLCATAAATATCGSCCDASPGLGGACTDLAAEADCTGANQTFALGGSCADITCSEVTGACCNGFDGTCTITLQAGCQGQNRTWTLGASCSSVSCEAIPGACCNHLNPDPLSLEGICTDGVLQADCNALEDSTWTKGSVCSSVACDANFQAIPTVSEWGLVVLTLLLLVGAKVYFGRTLRCPE